MVRDLSYDRWIACQIRLNAIREAQQADADEERAQDGRHPGECDRGAARLRFLERRYAVGDGLDARHGGTTSRERSQNQEDAERFYSGYRLKVPDDSLVLKQEDLDDANDDEQQGAADKYISWYREVRTRFAHAAQVHDGNDDNQGNIDEHNVWTQRREERCQRLDAC